MDFTGERFVPEERGNIAIEHLHRYMSASALVDSKIVLDIASGEGYGSDFLAGTAKHVYGVDIDLDSVLHSRKKYLRENLEFLVGSCTNIPLPDHSVDIIICLETLEHHDQHDESLVEFKRVLRRGGKLLISSPDRKYYSDARNFRNKFHVHELYEDEFRSLIDRHFKHANYYGQRVAYGSILMPQTGLTTTRSYKYSDDRIQTSPTVLEPLYLLALASDIEAGTLEAGIFEQPINETEIVQSWERAKSETDRALDQLRNEKVQLEREKHENERISDQKISDLERALDVEQRRALDLEADINTILNSKSFALTRPLRMGRRALQKLLSSASYALTGESVNVHRRLRNALGYVRRGDLRGLVSRTRHYRQQARQSDLAQIFENSAGSTWGIITTPHTLFIAQCIAERLARHGIQSVIMTEPEAEFDRDFYLVLCAQMFDRLPPSDKRVIFQLEQSVSSRWFTAKYIDAMENSVAVLDYSLLNIEFLASKKIAYPHVFYLPIGTSLNSVPPNAEKEFDFLFYGDYFSSPRRIRMLEALQARFNVRLCNDAFGEDMHALIRKARAVVNIHYYDNALLEMPRIQECLSQGVPVLSEAAQDQAEYPELNGAVHFFEQDSTEDLLRVAASMIESINRMHEAIERSVETSAWRFTFMFDRFLTGIGALPPTAILDDPIYVPENRPQIALSLPETISRRRIFANEKPNDCTVFDGIRNRRGWIGCGSSYSALARHARDKGQTELTIFEDDALFRVDHDERIVAIRNYLAHAPRWDVFSGMIASVHKNTRVRHVQKAGDITFVTLDRMTSMVFNIYNRHAIDLLANWNPANHDVDTNAIDRYLENQDDLHVVVALPFLVGHREDVTSTLWGFENDRYTLMIAEAEEKIELLAEEWLNSKKEPASH